MAEVIEIAEQHLGASAALYGRPRGKRTDYALAGLVTRKRSTLGKLRKRLMT